MAKTLCDWSKKDLERHADQLYELTHQPTHFCRKCARVANCKRVLCKGSTFAAAGVKMPVPFHAGDKTPAVEDDPNRMVA